MEMHPVADGPSRRCTSTRHGNPPVASCIFQDAESEFFIFREFDWLSARNLLHLQAELTDLEYRLESLETLRAQEVVASRAASGDTVKSRIDLMQLVRVKMKEYQEALLMQSQIAQIKQPELAELPVSRSCLPGRRVPALGKYRLEDEDDLIGLRTPLSEDAIHRLLQAYWPCCPRDTTRRTRARGDRGLRLAASIISIVIAAVLLIGAMSSLHYVKSPQMKLGSISGFTVAFAPSVGLLTNARTREIYAATASRAAVLVVFVSGDLG